MSIYNIYFCGANLHAHVQMSIWYMCMYVYYVQAIMQNGYLNDCVVQLSTSPILWDMAGMIMAQSYQHLYIYVHISISIYIYMYTCIIYSTWMDLVSTHGKRCGSVGLPWKNPRKNPRFSHGLARWAPLVSARSAPFFDNSMAGEKHIMCVYIYG